MSDWSLFFGWEGICCTNLSVLNSQYRPRNVYFVFLTLDAAVEYTPRLSLIIDSQPLHFAVARRVYWIGCSPLSWCFFAASLHKIFFKMLIFKDLLKSWSKNKLNKIIVLDMYVKKKLLVKNGKITNLKSTLYIREST